MQATLRILNAFDQQVLKPTLVLNIVWWSYCLVNRESTGTLLFIFCCYWSTKLCP